MNDAGIGSVVVTGAASGIGEACALHLHDLGFRVFAGIRNHSAADGLRRNASDRIVPVILDVTDRGSIQAAFERVNETVGDAGLNGLVNNAGIAVWGPLEHTPIEMLRSQFEVNVIGQMAVIQSFLPALRRCRGRIVNIGSTSGLVALPFLGPYSASKFALEALTDALRVELRPWDIPVAIVEAGAIATPIWRKSLASFDQLVQDLPPDFDTQYGSVMAKLRERAAEIGGLPPVEVAQAVAHALTARRAKTRYLIGKRTRMHLWTRWLPDRLRDWLIARKLP